MKQAYQGLHEGGKDQVQKKMSEKKISLPPASVVIHSDGCLFTPRGWRAVIRCCFRDPVVGKSILKVLLEWFL